MHMFAYIGPETIVPLTSAIAAVVGVVLMFWQFVFAMIKKPFQLFFGKKAAAPIQLSADGTPVVPGEAGVGQPAVPAELRSNN